MQTQRVRGQCAAEWKEFKQTPDLLTDLYDPVYKTYKTIKILWENG